MHPVPISSAGRHRVSLAIIWFTARSPVLATCPDLLIQIASADHLWTFKMEMGRPHSSCRNSITHHENAVQPENAEVLGAAAQRLEWQLHILDPEQSITRTFNRRTFQPSACENSWWGETNVLLVTSTWRTGFNLGLCLLTST